MYQKINKGFSRLSTWVQLLSPSHVLKLFPPHFIMRDVLMEQVEKTHKAGEKCVFFYYDVKKFAEFKNNYSIEIVDLVVEALKRAFSSVVKTMINEKDLLVVQQYYDDDFVVAIRREDRHMSYEELYRWTSLLGQQVEQAVKADISFFLDENISFHYSYVIVDFTSDDTYKAVRLAIEEARTVAKQHIPVSSSNVRAEMKRIVREEDIRVLAQPIISFDSGKIRGWEILTRGPENTPFMMPVNLFHFAYLTETLIALEIVVFKKALIEIEKKNTTSPIFINVTVPSLVSHYFYQAVMTLLKQYPSVRADRIVFEITERHSIDDFKILQECIKNFRKAGFKFAVDDTGAGYASLNVISELLPDVIKIDRSIIQDIDRNEVKDSVLQALLLIANKIGSEVVAEGIETEEEANLLLTKNVNLGQGFFFSRPQEPFPEMTENWVLKQKDRFVITDLT